MRINHNIAALNTYRQLSSNTGATSKSLEKLSSGLRINRAGDDAAGLAISEKMRGQIRGLDQASRNASDGISLIQTAEGALNETHSILQRMRELAVQSSNDTNTDVDRNEIQKEIDQLAQEITRISTDTEFNTMKLLNGDFGTKATTSDATKLTVVSALSDSISAGTTSITATTKATVSTHVGSAAAAATTTFANESTLVVNDIGITFNKGDYTRSELVSRINEFSDKTGVTASVDGSGVVTLTALKAGAQTISVDGDANAAIFTSKDVSSVSGANATITGISGTIVADKDNGNRLTVTDGAHKGLVLEVQGTGATAVALTITKSQLTFHIGANESQSMSASIQNMSAKSLGVDGLDLTTQDGANTAIKTLDSALSLVSGERAKLGSIQNRLEHTINNLGTSSENLSAAESRIRDVDMAKEMMEFTKNNILSQASQAMLAQANQQPQSVLQLLQ